MFGAVQRSAAFRKFCVAHVYTAFHSMQDLIEGNWFERIWVQSLHRTKRVCTIKEWVINKSYMFRYVFDAEYVLLLLLVTRVHINPFHLAKKHTLETIYWCCMCVMSCRVHILPIAAFCTKIHNERIYLHFGCYCCCNCWWRFLLNFR